MAGYPVPSRASGLRLVLQRDHDLPDRALVEHPPPLLQERVDDRRGRLASAILAAHEGTDRALVLPVPRKRPQPMAAASRLARVPRMAMVAPAMKSAAHSRSRAASCPDRRRASSPPPAMSGSAPA